ncbi:hypothetical protein Airi01_028870 [Actinoallomurus iriomotensis]|uniref:Uncharacterized protein n=1 Tax=Actinoallomurus iriomotensis TaxID=478107 RepID=A0A9W6RIP8_9ACTN|nr:hypothetical protein Airi01_028870 [Actinoallomurus iriomotensis]
MQVSEGTFHDPALGAGSGAVLGAASSDHWLHSEVPDEAAVFVVIVAAVAERQIGAASRPAAPAAHAWCRLKQRDESSDVVAVAAGQRGGERDAAGVGDQVMFAARLAPIDWASSGLGSPQAAPGPDSPTITGPVRP